MFRNLSISRKLTGAFAGLILILAGANALVLHQLRAIQQVVDANVSSTARAA